MSGMPGGLRTADGVYCFQLSQTVSRKKHAERSFGRNGRIVLSSKLLAVLGFCLLLVAGVMPAQTKSSAPTGKAASLEVIGSGESSRLPVKRVVLYKNGVGYFEHSARVHGDQELGIDFTTAQLNDVLKSLTVVDLGDGRISGVRYNSIRAVGRASEGAPASFRRAGFSDRFPDSPPRRTSRSP